ncbi:hypothetical protein FA95DRAFT_1565718 [Auriscalpium vulgare]|uniref:Uncharacterized protein n=1 Tax=Auriscalpium vulgare TaxID=40419 RepID=A0ACB8RAE9_9AGAM|nr:hypothetical protein FA95DRAFT_1565718 [Auriscalpium vulgare]
MPSTSATPNCHPADVNPSHACPDLCNPVTFLGFRTLFALSATLFHILAPSRLSLMHRSATR